MARCTAKEVVNVTASTASCKTIDSFIIAANVIITRAVSNGCPITDSETLKQAEIFTTAHLLSTSGASNGKAGVVKTKERFENYEVTNAIAQASGDGFLSTHYGQTANTLMDGWLIHLNKAANQVVFA